MTRIRRTVTAVVLATLTAIGTTLPAHADGPADRVVDTDDLFMETGGLSWN